MQIVQLREQFEDELDRKRRQILYDSESHFWKVLYMHMQLVSVHIHFGHNLGLWTV